MTDPSNVQIDILDSITKLTDAHRGRVIVAASHGAEYAAYLGAKGGARVDFPDPIIPTSQTGERSLTPPL